MTHSALQGHRYRARIEVGFFKRAFASVDLIAGKLRDAGFTDVRVQADESVSGRYWAWGVWPGPDAAAEELPDEIVDVVDITQDFAR